MQVIPVAVFPIAEPPSILSARLPILIPEPPASSRRLNDIVGDAVVSFAPEDGDVMLIVGFVVSFTASFKFAPSVLSESSFEVLFPA